MIAYDSAMFEIQGISSDALGRSGHSHLQSLLDPFRASAVCTSVLRSPGTSFGVVQHQFHGRLRTYG